MQNYIIDSSKASQMWGGVLVGYSVLDSEIKSVEDEIHGDMLIKVWANEIQEVHNLDMCVNGKMSSRDSAHCIGSSCDFCGKFEGGF